MSNMTIILNFLTEYKAWVEAGVPESNYFDATHGLCGNLDKYVMRKYNVIGNRLIAIGDCLVSLFDEDGLSSILPFNIPMHGQPRYMHEVHHKNPWRMKWVADTIIKLEAKQNES